MLTMSIVMIEQTNLLCDQKEYTTFVGTYNYQESFGSENLGRYFD